VTTIPDFKFQIPEKNCKPTSGISIRVFNNGFSIIHNSCSMRYTGITKIEASFHGISDVVKGFDLESGIWNLESLKAF
jgi:hypothetical protein